MEKAAADADLEAKTAPARARKTRAKQPQPPGDPLGDFLGSRQGKALQREVVRGIFGMLKKRL